MADDLTKRGYELSPPRNPIGQGSECSQAGEHVELLGQWRLSEGLEAPCPFPHLALGVSSTDCS